MAGIKDFTEESLLDKALKGVGETKPEEPKPKTERKPRDVAPVTPISRRSSLEKRLTDMLVSIGVGVSAMDPVCGGVVVAQAPDVAASLDKLANENKAVKRALERMMQGGAWGGVVMSMYPILVTILAHHGILPAQVAGMMGIEPRPARPKPTPKPVPAARKPNPEADTVDGVVPIGGFQVEDGATRVDAPD